MLLLPSRSRSRFAVCLLLWGSLLLGGCAGGAAAQSDGPPDWFVNPDQAYDSSRYLLAPAEGPSAQAAENRAFGNLARRFVADVEADQSLVDEYQEVKTDGEVTGSQQKTVMITESDVQSDQSLLNTQVLERAQVGSKHYALVGMERRETLEVYAQRIERNGQKIEDYRSTAANTDHPITRLTALQKALVLARANETLRKQRSIIAGGAAATESSAVPALEKEVRAAQVECPVFIRGEGPSSIRTEVGATLEEIGFRAVSDPGDALLEVAVTYRERPTLTSREDAHFLRWTLAIELTDTRRNQTLETFTTEQRAGAPSKAAAQRRAHNGARTAVDTDFSNFVKRTLLQLDPS